jgi:hypothetical protein
MDKTMYTYRTICRACGAMDAVVCGPGYDGDVNNGDVPCEECKALDTLEILSQKQAS